MSNTVITNFRDASGPRSSADSPFVVVLERDGTISLDNAALEGLVGGDGSQSAGISVVRVGQDGKPDDATDSENEDERVPHVTLTVDGYYDDPNGIAKYDSGIEMLQSLSNETREHSLIGFQNDHCYTSLTSPSQSLPSQPASEISYDDISTQAKQNIPSSKKITILEQQIIPKGKKIVFNPTKAPVILKGNDALSKPLPVISSKSNKKSTANKANVKQTQQPNSGSEKTESSGGSISGESVNDRDSDADYKCTGEGLAVKTKKPKSVLRGVRKVFPKNMNHPKPIVKVIPKSKQTKSLIRQEIKDTLLNKKAKIQLDKKTPSILSRRKIDHTVSATSKIHKEPVKLEPKPEPPKPVKVVKKEKKTPAHMTALLSDMTSLFSTPDVIRRVSTDGKTKGEKSTKETGTPEASETDKPVIKQYVKTYTKNKERCITEVKEMETIPQIDDASLARLLQEPTSISSGADTTTTTTNPLSSPNLGPLSPNLDLLAGLQPEEEDLTEDLLMHVAQLVESSENLQEVIDKEVLGKVDPVPAKTSSAPSTPMTAQTFAQAAANAKIKVAGPQPQLVQIVRSNGRVITLPPIEAPATRSSKRKSQGPVQEPEPVQDIPPMHTPEPMHLQSNPKQYSNKKIPPKNNEPVMVAVEPIKPAQVSEDSMNSEDDPYRLWCICKQPHNNRFMICCDLCEDWFHGKCVNITKSMGQQMEEQGVEWTCPNCIKKMNTPKSTKSLVNRKNIEGVSRPVGSRVTSESPGPTCIVCEKLARSGSIYCSDACILRHAQESLGNSPGGTKSEHTDKGESRIIVFERKSGRVLQGIHAPTADNLKTWLQEHPTYEVVRRERLNKPMVNVKKPVARPQQKIQTTLKIDKEQKQIILLQPQPKPSQIDSKPTKSVPASPQDFSPKTPIVVKRPQLKQTLLMSKDGSLAAKPATPIAKQPQQTPKQTTPMPKLVPVSPKTPDSKKVPAKISLVRSQSVADKSLRSPTPVTRTRKEKEPETKSKPVSDEPIRENVRKALQEHMTLRLAETKGVKFSDEEIKKFAYNTEMEMHNLFKDVSMKYKAKYRSLIFNIKDRKNLSLWNKICDRSLTPKQLVRMSPEELASQELAQWRDKEAKYQLELIKKSELDLLAASKTYVLKTHKGEEVMEQKSVAAEVDPNVAVEDLVTALNDSAAPDDDLQKDDKSKHSRQKDSRKKSPHRDTPTRSSSRHKSNKEEKIRAKKKNKEDKERSVDEKRTRRGYRSHNRTKDKSKHPDKDKRRSKSKDNSDSKTRSRSRERSRHRSRSRGRSRARRRSRSKSKSSKKKSVSRDRQLRSLSQENVYHSKDKYSYNDGEIERPKSAMQKESHPEYDPHEPMITSAFSEEDLRRSRETSFDEGYPEDVVVPGYSESEEYDPSKVLSFDANPPTLASSSRSNRVPSEVESDQEPTSTVDSAAPPVWNGLVNMVDVARFYVDAHQVSGNCADLEEDLTSELEIVGRINPETVWDYIGKMKRTGNKDILVLRLVSSHSATVEERMQYIALYSYLSSRNRLGVVKVTNTSVKDFYMFPLAATASLPEVLLPLDGPGLDDVRTHLLFALIVRQKKKRSAPTKIDTSPAKAAKTSSRKRSYTPPVTNDSSYTPPTSPARTRRSNALRLPLPFVPPSPALSSSVKDKIAASLANAEEEEPYSPGGSSSGESVAGADVLRSRVDEINRQIEEQKQQILSIATNVNREEDEAYSPSGPMTPPRPALADIALPSNLHEILATIQQRSSEPTPPAPPPEDVDMRVPPPPAPQGHLHALSEEELLRMVPDDAH